MQIGITPLLRPPHLVHKDAHKEFYLWGKHIFTLLAPSLWALIYDERKWLLWKCCRTGT